MKSLADGMNRILSEGALTVLRETKVLENNGQSQNLAHYLLHEAGVACLPGTAFGLGGEGYLRFSYTTSFDVISEAIPLVKQSIERLKK